MNETRLCTIEQIEQFLSTSESIQFSATGDDRERYGHISRVLTRFDYPGRSKRERGVLHRYLQLQPGSGHASGDPVASQPTGLRSHGEGLQQALIIVSATYREASPPVRSGPSAVRNAKVAGKAVPNE